MASNAPPNRPKWTRETLLNFLRDDFKGTDKFGPHEGTYCILTAGNIFYHLRQQKFDAFEDEDLIDQNYLLKHQNLLSDIAFMQRYAEIRYDAVEREGTEENLPFREFAHQAMDELFEEFLEQLRQKKQRSLRFIAGIGAGKLAQTVIVSTRGPRNAWRNIGFGGQSLIAASFLLMAHEGFPHIEQAMPELSGEDSPSFEEVEEALVYRALFSDGYTFLIDSIEYWATTRLQTEFEACIDIEDHLDGTMSLEDTFYSNAWCLNRYTSATPEDVLPAPDSPGYSDYVFEYEKDCRFDLGFDPHLIDSEDIPSLREGIRVPYKEGPEICVIER